MGQFWGQDLVWSLGSRESWPPREGAFAGIFIPAASIDVCVCILVYIFVFIFLSQLLFASRDSSLWAAGVAGAPCLHEAPCFCFPVVGENWVKTSSFLKKMSCCCVWLVGDAVGSPAPSRGGWQGPVPVSHHEDIFLLLTHLSNWGGSLSYWADWSPIFGLYPCL